MTKEQEELMKEMSFVYDPLLFSTSIGTYNKTTTRSLSDIMRDLKKNREEEQKIIEELERLIK